MDNYPPWGLGKIEVEEDVKEDWKWANIMQGGKFYRIGKNGIIFWTCDNVWAEMKQVGEKINNFQYYSIFIKIRTEHSVN